VRAFLRENGEFHSQDPSEKVNSVKIMSSEASKASRLLLDSIVYKRTTLPQSPSGPRA
jgi:hypothetical protein